MTDQESSTSGDAADPGSEDSRPRESAQATLTGTSSGDTLQGTADADTISGLAGGDNLFGGAGNDTLIGGTGSDFIDGEAGIDLVDYSTDAAGVTVNLSTGTATDGNGDTDTLSSIENILGSSFNDTLIGSTAVNVITGGTGTDTLEGRGGSDTLDGGGNTDTVSYANAPGGAVINLTTGTASDGYGQTDTLISIENVIGSANGDTITGDTIANQIFAGGGNDTVSGLTGDDLIEGQGGADTLDGGEGDDQVEGGLGEDIILGGDGDDILIGGGGSDTIDGGAGNDTLFLEINGEAGADATRFTDVNLSTGVISSDGINTVSATITTEDNTGTGGTRTDFSNTQSGAEKVGGSFSGTLEDTGDPLTGDEDFVRIDLVANTRYTFQLSRSGVTVDETAPFLALLSPAGTFLAQADDAGVFGSLTTEFSFIPETSGTYFLAIRNPELRDATYTVTVSNAGVDSVVNVENVVGSDQDDNITGTDEANSLSGSDGADTLRGLAGPDVLDGGSGADKLFGGSGNDILVGGAGRDLLHGGDGVDEIDYSQETARLQMDLALGTARTTADNVDTLVGIEIITGTPLDDSMRGDRLANTLDGNDGNDVINGFGGQDTLTGGLGDDDIDGGSGNDIITGGDGNDTLTGGRGDDTIDPGLGDDTIDGGIGWDVITLSGEWGADRVIATDAFAVIDLSDVDGDDINAAPSGNDLLVTVPGRTAQLTLVNFVGNEGNFLVRDMDGNIINLNGSGTTVDTALKLRSDEMFTATVGAANNTQDYYSVTAPTDGDFTLSVSGAAAGTTVQFLNTAGGIIATTTTDSNGNASVTIAATRSETYILSVSASSQTDYTATVSFAAENLNDSVSNPVNVSIPMMLQGLTLDLTTNPVDAYRIVAPDNMTLVMNTSNVTGDLDLRVYDSLGNLIKESAQTGTVAEGMSITVQRGEAYIVEVIARDSSVTANLQLTLEDLDESGANGSIETAQNISENSSLSGSVGIDPNFADYYTFTVATAGELVVNLQNLQDDLRIDLYDASGTRIGQAQTGGSANELLIQNIQAGTYFIGVVAQNTLVSSPYDLDVSFSVPDAADTPSTATDFGGLPLDVTQTVGAGSDSADYFAFTAAADGTVTATLTGLTGNIGLEALDSGGTRLDSDALGNTLDKSITFAIGNGETFSIGAIPTSEGANGSYRIEAAFVEDAGDAIAAPTNVDVNFSRTEAIGFNGDDGDYYRIFPSQSGTLTVDLNNLSAPVDLRLYTTDGTRLTSSQNTGSTPEQITFDLNANTGYVIEVVPTSTAAQGFYDITSSYTVSSSAQAAAQVRVVDEDQVGS